MIELLVVSLIWAFSFGMIKDTLAGVDPIFITFARLFISFLVFVPFMKLKSIQRPIRGRLILVGALQFGCMYIAYNYSFHFLKSYEVALFTVLTPIYIAIIHNIIHRKFNWLYVATALLAIIGTGIIKRTNLVSQDLLIGFLLVQISNLCFAFGQIYYREIMGRQPNLKDLEGFGLLYLGGMATAAIASLAFTPWASLHLTGDQGIALVYLGAVASGVGFFLWNDGARKVNAGALAVLNNIKIPLAISVSLIVFQEQADIPGLIIGGTIILAALAMNEIIQTKILKKEDAALQLNSVE